NGQGLATYNLSVLQSGIQNINFYASPYVPSYMDQIQGIFTQRATNGLFSFNQLNKQTPYFTDSGPQASNILINKGNVILPTQFTISFWINKNPSAGGCDSIIGEPSSAELDIFSQTGGGACSAGSVSNTYLSANYVDLLGVSHTSYNSIPVIAGVWSQVALVFGANTISWFINGARVSKYTGLINPGVNSNAFIIGAGDRSFNGFISNVQVYNAPLTPFDIQTIYRNGITGYPTKPANIIAWYPLNGNGNDYSGYNKNGTTNNVVFQTISGYYGDPIFKNIATSFNTSVVEGAINCFSINNCANNVPQLYLGNFGLANGASGARLNESAALNLGNALLPRVLSFTQNSYVQQIAPLVWLKTPSQSFSMSIWILPSSNNGVVIDEFNSTSNIHDPWISLNNGVGDIGYNGVGSVLVCNAIGTIPTNTWSDITITFNGPTNTLNAYLNGANRFTNLADLGRGTNPAAAYYDLGKRDGTNCGTSSGLNYNGLMSDFQVYNSALTANQALALYLNDSVNIAPVLSANLIYQLSTSPSTAAPNQTLERVLGNFGVFYTETVPCNVVSMATGLCGVGYVPP
ncbi:MAG: LamG-like jellyroll fold domain-containing protein, partial [Candidatus Micrarchaeales archaeon]